MRLRRMFTYLVGAVSVSLVAALTGGVAWQYKYGPLTRLSATEISSGPKAFEDRKKILQGLLTMINYLSIAKTFEDRAYDLIDNWANKKQTGGPDDFMDQLENLQTGYHSVINGFPYILGTLPYAPDVQALTKVEVIPDCLERTRSVYAEIKKIKENKGADVAFTAEDNTKLAEWRAGVPECDKWISDRLDATKKKYIEYGGH
jgi:hypothetical protein